MCSRGHQPKYGVLARDSASPAGSGNKKRRNKHKTRNSSVYSPFLSKHHASSIFTNLVHLPSTSRVHTSAAHKLAVSVSAHPHSTPVIHWRSVVSLPPSNPSQPHHSHCGIIYPNRCMIGPWTR